jgi:beta-xylosidase
VTRNRRRVLRVIASILFCASAFGQHAVIREYAALAPTADVTPLQPLLEIPLTDVSIALGHDGAYYMTGSAVAGEAAAYTPAVTLWRSPDLAKWTKLRTISIPGKAVRSPEVNYLGNRYWLTLGLEGSGTELLSFDTPDLAKSRFHLAKITDTGDDPSLFLDDDGAFYWVMGAGEIARMRSDPMQGLAEDRGRSEEDRREDRTREDRDSLKRHR